MKAAIHPDYKESQVSCACGNKFTTKSTKEKIVVESCNKCHSFYTGDMTSGVSTGAVDKFNKKYGIK